MSFLFMSTQLRSIFDPFPHMGTYYIQSRSLNLRLKMECHEKQSKLIICCKVAIFFSCARYVIRVITSEQARTFLWE